MAKKTEVIGFSKIQQKLLDAVKSIENDKTIVSEVGKEAARQITARTKAGKEEYKTQNISKETVKSREYLKQYNATDPALRKNKALTFTGQLLNSIKSEVKGDTARITFDGTHDGYNTKNGKTKGIDNSKLARILQEERKFFFISREMKEKILSPLLGRLAKAQLKKIFKTK